MLKRVFIAINLPEEIKEALVALQKKWPGLPVRWTKKDNLHLTLLFLGNVSQEQLKEVLDKTRQVASAREPFELVLTKICYGPPQKMPPRLVWVEGETSPALVSLQEKVEQAIGGTAAFQYKEREKRAYHPHLTLGRIRQWEFRRLEAEERPEIDEEVALAFPVNSLELMESQLKRKGAEYTILRSIPLGAKNYLPSDIRKSL